MKLKLKIHINPILIDLEIDENFDIEDGENFDIEDDWSSYEEEIVDAVIEKIETWDIVEVINRDKEVLRVRNERMRI